MKLNRPRILTVRQILMLVTIFTGLAGPGKGEGFQLVLRSRTPDSVAGHLVQWREATWSPQETAVIVCDMWDSHHCYNAVQRVKDVAPRMNAFLERTRQQGALIIHAPSSCTTPYDGYPGRKLAQAAPPAGSLPPGIENWCDRIPAEEAGIYPIDQTDGGEDDDLITHQRWHEQLRAAGRTPGSPWQRQIDALRIDDRDAISDSGIEIWNLLQQRNIRHVMLVGVHTNMCVLGRPFGLRQLAKNGIDVVLVRDLTDTMYNPAMWPFVSHHSGTDRIVEHIEKFVCPTVESSQIMGGKPFRFYDDHRPVVAMVVSEEEYETTRTLPALAARHLGRDFHVRMTLNHDMNQHRIAGLNEVLADADVLILSLWRRALPADQLAAIRAHLDAGKHLVAIRTSSHGFMTRDGMAPPDGVLWPDFDQTVLGGHYQGHHGNKVSEGAPRTLVRILGNAKQHPIVTGLPQEEVPVPSWLYKMNPLSGNAVPLIMGRVEGRQPEEPVAWTHETAAGGRVFYTSLGHPEEFADPSFQRLLVNAVYWAASRPIPELFPLTAADNPRTASAAKP